MTAGKLINGWTLVAILLVAVIIIGAGVIYPKFGNSHPLEITVIPEPEFQGEIYVSGEVTNPGLYPLESADTIQDILMAAGGSTGDADPNRLALRVYDTLEALPQRININLAEAWLLEALPGIGEVKAQAIIEYRLANGPFRHTGELLDVAGMGMAGYEKIKHLITVTE